MLVLDPSFAAFLLIIGWVFAVAGWVGPSREDIRRGHSDLSDMQKGFGRGGCSVLIGVILTILVWWAIVNLDIHVK